MMHESFEFDGYIYIYRMCTNPGRQVTRVTRHLMFVCPQYGTCFVTLLAPRILGRILDFCTPGGYDVHFVVTDVL
jgi:predicted RNA-binding Zn-ribbon protein involved in translation (DUF1610 family)